MVLVAKVGYLVSPGFPNSPLALRWQPELSSTCVSAIPAFRMFSSLSWLSRRVSGPR